MRRTALLVALVLAPAVALAQSRKAPEKPAPSRVAEYRITRDRIVALRKGLDSARVRNLIRDDRRWGQFASRFQEEHDQIEARFGVMPLAERGRFGDALGMVQNMFLDTVFPKPDDYRKFEELYNEDMRWIEERIGPPAKKPAPKRR